MAGNIHRRKKSSDFVTLDTHCSRNKGLRWGPKGLHNYLMQLPDDWKVNIADLEKRSLDKRDATSSAMNALIKAGYVVRERKHDEKGRFEGYDYQMFERPEHAIEWLTVNGKSVNGSPVNGKTATSKVLKPLSEVSKNEGEGEGDTPTPEPSTSKQKPKSVEVAPAENPETVKAEIAPLPKVAPKGIPPSDVEAEPQMEDFEDIEMWLSYHTLWMDRIVAINSQKINPPTHIVTETDPSNPSLKIVTGLRVSEPTTKTVTPKKVSPAGNYEPSNFDIYGVQPLEIMEGETFAEMEDRLGRQTNGTFEVTAIASPTELPGVTLVEVAPIHHRRNGRIEIPDEAAAEILPWANGEGEETVKKWYSQAYRHHSPKDVEAMVMRFSTVFLSSEKAAIREMMETNPLAFFKKRFSGFVIDQPAFDRMNTPKEGGQTRQNGQPQRTLTSNMRVL